MTKIFQSSVFRALCAIVIGALLVVYPDNTVTGITIAIGVLFLVSGIISCVTYFWSKRHVSDYKIYDAEGRLVAGEQPTFPIVGIGSAILGLILALMPTAFISALMYIIGIILIVFARRKIGVHPYILVVTCGDGEAEKAVFQALDSAVARYSVKAKTVNPAGIELSIEVTLRDGDTTFVTPLFELDGVASASLVTYNGQFAD